MMEETRNQSTEAFFSEPAGIVTSIWEPGTIILKDYKIVKKLGQGGAGIVYLVEHTIDEDLFAVKVPLFTVKGDPRKQRLFFRELRTWIELPEHPNLTACRFIRTFEDCLMIFAEYVDGGSLNNWISQLKLLTIREILDVAIQFAWGLQAAHDNQIVHQDIKPANVLLSLNGVVKITDFGLARAHELAKGYRNDPVVLVNQDDHFLSTGVMTPAFCSPEQYSMKQRLDYRTDIWSYGLSILTLFSGPPTWMIGVMAPELLKGVQEKGSHGPFPPIPEDLADILLKCFQKNPADRWQSMGEISERLIWLYQKLVGEKYPRSIPEPIQNLLRKESLSHPDSVDLKTGDEPMDFLARAFEVSGRDMSELALFFPDQQGSRRAIALMSLEVLEEAHRMLNDLIASGRVELTHELARLITKKARVHLQIDDLGGSAQIYLSAIDILTELVAGEPHQDWIRDLLIAKNERAYCFMAMNEHHQAVLLFQEIIQQIDSMAFKFQHQHLINAYAQAYLNLGTVMTSLRDYSGAVAVFNQAAEIIEPLIRGKDWFKIEHLLSKIYLNVGVILNKTGDLLRGVQYHDKAIDMLQSLIERDTGNNYNDDLARVYVNKAVNVDDQGDHGLAIALYDRAIGILEKLVNDYDYPELRITLAKVCANKGSCEFELNRFEESKDLSAKSVGIMEQIVYREGLREHRWLLSAMYRFLMEILQFTGDLAQAQEIGQKSGRIMESLVYEEGRMDMLPELADIYRTKATVIENPNAQLTVIDQSLEILETLVHEENQREVAENLAKVYGTKANILNRLARYSDALILNEKSVAVLEKLIGDDNRSDLIEEMAEQVMFKGITLRLLGEYCESLRCMDSGIDLLDPLVREQGRVELLPQILIKKAQKAITLEKMEQRLAARDLAQEIIPAFKNELGRVNRRDIQEAMSDLEELMKRSIAPAE